MELVNKIVVWTTFLYVLASAALNRPMTVSANLVDNAISSFGSMVNPSNYFESLTDNDKGKRREKNEANGGLDKSGLKKEFREINLETANPIEREISAQMYLAEIINVTKGTLKRIDRQIQCSDKCVALNYSTSDIADTFDELMRSTSDLAEAYNNHNQETDQQVHHKQQRLDFYRDFKSNKKDGSGKKFPGLGGFQKQHDLMRLNELRKELARRAYHLLGNTVSLYYECMNDLMVHYGSNYLYDDTVQGNSNLLELRMNLIPLSSVMGLLSTIVVRCEDVMNNRNAESGSGLAASFADVVIPITLADYRLQADDGTRHAVRAQ